VKKKGGGNTVPFVKKWSETIKEERGQWAITDRKQKGNDRKEAAPAKREEVLKRKKKKKTAVNSATRKPFEWGGRNARSRRGRTVFRKFMHSKSRRSEEGFN